jgi:hypothetical protein
MIWNVRELEPGSSARVIAYVADAIHGICGRELLAESADVEEVAGAVSRFVAESGRAAVDARYLMVLAARALAAVGEKTAARRVYVFGSGLVRPSEWEVTGGQAVWVLDLKQMTTDGSWAHEMLLLVSLHVVLDGIADVWDETRGRGVLGLRHVCSVAAALAGRGGRGKREAAASEIRDWCVAKLSDVSRRRGWGEAPSVLDLDGSGR